MTAAPLAHIISGPLDAILELGLPIALLVVLWAWSVRAERKKGQKTDDMRRSSRGPKRR